MVQITRESSALTSLYLEPEAECVAPFKPGRSLIVKLDIDDKSIIRKYTLSSAPQLGIGVEREQAIDSNNEQGLTSSRLCQQVQFGDIISIKAALRRFYFRRNFNP